MTHHLAFDHTLGYPGEGPPSKVANDGRLRHHAADVKGHRTRHRDLRRGGNAWARPSSLGAEPLLVHTVVDNTGLRYYLPAVRNFLNFALESGMAMTDRSDHDMAMAQYFNKLAYEEEKHPIFGDYVLHGFAYVWPEAAGRLPRAARCLLGWHKIFVHGEGSPLPLELLAVVEELYRTKNLTAEADALAVGVDCYLRSQEVFNLRVEDVIVSDQGSEVVLKLGVASRGELTKTGAHQGVRVDYPHTKQILARLVQDRPPGEKLFATNKAKYVKAWAMASKELDVDLGPPHSVRHSGPSHDCACGYRSMWQVQRRGRWASEKSVMRYAKSHAWIEARSKVPKDIMQRGTVILSARDARQEAAPD